MTTIESLGVTALAEVAGTYFLYAAGTTTGPQLMRGGAAVTTGQYGAWTPIGAEKTTYGYEVAWKNDSTGQSVVWATDANGNYLSDMVAPVSGVSDAFKALEPSFMQDLNNDTNLAPAALIEDSGNTRLNNILDQFLLSEAGGTPGPVLRYGGAAVTAGQFGAWTPVGAEKTTGGYEVVWKNGNTGQFMVWTVDNLGNWLSQGPAVSSSSIAMQSREATFGQDFNGDGTTGWATVAVETQGGTSLTQGVNGYSLYASGTSSGPQLKYGGAAYVAWQFGNWTPIGAEKTASGGYMVAWNMAGTDQYTVWTTDSNGNWLSQTANMSGASNALKAFEPGFAQDLNGDGVTQAALPPLESQGNTSLVQVLDRFFLNASSGAWGPGLSRGGMPVTAGQYGAWTPIGAEKTTYGYEVAWKNDSTGQSLVWATDAAGNYLSDVVAPVSGASNAFKAIEASFSQDLNGDSNIASVSPIDTSGATRLDQVLGQFFLNEAGGMPGPLLRYGGAAVTAGQFGAWTPVGAEKTASGYEVVWQNGTASQFIVWTVDNFGNWQSQGPAVSGFSGAIESREATFGQDFNGDGTTGLTAAAIETQGGTDLTQVVDGYFLYASGTSSGPELRRGGTPVTTGQYGTWSPIGAEKTSAGYLVAWKNSATGQFIFWTTDSAGNYQSDSGVLDTSSGALVAYEPVFNYDFNGANGVTPLGSPIESAGTTSLYGVGENYLLRSAGNAGVVLKSGGSPVHVAQFAGWTPIAAEQTATGYQVVWKNAISQLYVEWTTDSNGNLVSQGAALSGGKEALQARETFFGQDLNGDTQTGLATNPIESAGATSLTQVGEGYVLGGSGPQLKYGGAAVTSGQFGSWAPIGVEATASGYKVVWKMAGQEQYIDWATDSNGNYLSQGSAMAGASYSLESIETSFGQDLNSDGTVGVVSTLIETTGLSTLAQVANNYVLFDTGTTNGPMLKYGGVAVTQGQFAGWTPIAVEKTAGGYDVAWKAAGDSYVVWATDNDGNFQSQPVNAVNANVMTAFEPVFHQDFGDAGTTIASPTTIESIGSASLLQVNGIYYVSKGGELTGPLTYGNGLAQFAGWTAYAATAAGSGYQVAWQHSDGVQKVVWNVDSAGHMLSSTATMFTSSSALESFETAFQQDLNGNGSIGVTVSAFNINLDFGADGPDATETQYLPYFTQAVARWQQIIVGDIPAVDSANYGYSYGIVDDVRVLANIGPIDGDNFTLARAGWLRIRNSDIPWLGSIEVDSADVARMASDGRLKYAVEHEIAHALGFNEQIWSNLHLTDGNGYIGEHGLYAYRMLTGNQSATFVPITGSHLVESVFGTELMTTTMIQPPGPLSILTIAIFEDMGYKVNYSMADPYSMPAGLMAGLQSGSAPQGNALDGGAANHEEVPDLHMANVDNWLIR